MGKLLLCDHDGCSYTGSTAQALGIHRRKTHGIMGQSQAAAYRRNRIEAQDKRPEEKHAGNSKVVPAPELPVLGQVVQVTLLAMDPASGEVTVGLDGKWMAVLR